MNRLREHRIALPMIVYFAVASFSPVLPIAMPTGISHRSESAVRKRFVSDDGRLGSDAGFEPATTDGSSVRSRPTRDYDDHTTTEDPSGHGIAENSTQASYGVDNTGTQTTPELIITLPPPCCIVNEEFLTWFWSITFAVIVLVLATWKYMSKHAETEPSLQKGRLVLLRGFEAEQEKAIAAIPKKPVDVSKFGKHLDQRRKYPVLFRAEFQLISRVEPHSLRHALKTANELKHHNKFNLPYDYNRVVLEPEPDVPDSDYINASHIDSILKPNAYIATQGPNENTVGDFWRMVWQQRSYVIVMLTKVFDFIRVMCTQYWPANNDAPEVYSGLEITLLDEEPLANFIIRTIRIRKGHEERTVTQLHYTEWPAHSCPFSNAILEFRRRVRVYMERYQDGGPVIVHCSDGCGRTGVYICLDANLELSEEDNFYDVFGYARRLRAARKGMIETLGQYKFVYETLEEAGIFGASWFPVTELSRQLKYKSMKDPISKQNEYQKEYEKICRMTSKFSIGDCAGGHRLENRDKNRDVAIVPPDNFRPYLSSFQSNENTDYINAVFVDGYTKSKEYIVTEWPLKHTCMDFWSMVYDHDCNTIVVLCNPSASAANPPFWPEKEKRKKYGPVFTVEAVSSNHYPNVKTWIFKLLKKKPNTMLSNPRHMLDQLEAQKVVSLTELMAGVKAETKTTQIFQLTCWPQGHKVPTSTNAVVELMNMVERWRQRTDYGPVAVVSTNGKSRAGVYCAANVAIEQVVQHQEVDVFQAVKTVRRHRPQLIENMMEYKYCYDLVLHYVLYYLNNK